MLNDNKDNKFIVILKRQNYFTVDDFVKAKYASQRN